MKKFTLFIALAVACAAAPLMAPASAQELNLGPMIDPMVGANAAAQQDVIEGIRKHSRNSRARIARGTRRYRRGRLSTTGRRTRATYRTNRTTRRTSYRLRR